jgi:AdoMet-dependent rRNA methyltransferase SPB1
MYRIVSSCYSLTTQLAEENEGDEDDDEFEIVPQDAEDDGSEWDVDDEDQDEVKKKIIQGAYISAASTVSC